MIAYLKDGDRLQHRVVGEAHREIMLPIPNPPTLAKVDVPILHERYELVDMSLRLGMALYHRRNG